MGGAGDPRPRVGVGPPRRALERRPRDHDGCDDSSLRRRSLSGEQLRSPQISKDVGGPWRPGRACGAELLVGLRASAAVSSLRPSARGGPGARSRTAGARRSPWPRAPPTARARAPWLCLPLEQTRPRRMSCPSMPLICVWVCAAHARERGHQAEGRRGLVPGQIRPSSSEKRGWHFANSWRPGAARSVPGYRAKPPKRRLHRTGPEKRRPMGFSGRTNQIPPQEPPSPTTNKTTTNKQNPTTNPTPLHS